MQRFRHLHAKCLRYFLIWNQTGGQNKNINKNQIYQAACFISYSISCLALTNIPIPSKKNLCYSFVGKEINIISFSSIYV